MGWRHRESESQLGRELEAGACDRACLFSLFQAGRGPWPASVNIRPACWPAGGRLRQPGNQQPGPPGGSSAGYLVDATRCWAPSMCRVTYTQHLITSFTVALFGLFYYFYLADEETALGMVQPPAVKSPQKLVC